MLTMIYAINDTNAKVQAVLTIHGAENKDWEDIACGKCVGHMTDFSFYIGDIGDSGKSKAETIYRVQEPGSVTTQTLNVEAKLMYSWSESDADTLMLTPDAELYIVSKVSGGHGLIAHIPSAGWGQGSQVFLASSTYLQHVTSTHKDPLGGDISPDGKEILIKMREQILHYTVPDGGDAMTVLSRETPYVLPYTMEKKGEGIAFSADGNSYYTLGEGDNEPLYRYAGYPIFGHLVYFTRRLSIMGEELFSKSAVTMLCGLQSILEDLLSGEIPYVMPYTKEKGEGFAFSADGNSYFTLGEGAHEQLCESLKV